VRKRNIVVLGLAAVIAVTIGLFLLVGVYIDPPFGKDYPGETVVFYRRLLMTPLLFSADSIALEYGAVPNDPVREVVSRTMQARLERYVLLRLPFNRRLYLMTTGNKDFVNVEADRPAGERRGGLAPSASED
jgi:hypothetical protein